jgi:hypothetical protein
MGRRASSSPQPFRVILTVALLIGLAGGGYALYGWASDPYRKVPPLPVQRYLENSNSLRGNVYRLDATVGRALEYSARSGRLFSVVDSEGEVVAVLVPAELNSVNIERGQRFFFKIAVGEKGILRVQEVRKA